MLLLTVLIYPALLAALLFGAGLLVDRASGGFLPGALLLSAGAALLIAATQLIAYVHQVAPVSPYAVLVIGAAGIALGRRRGLELARSLASRPARLAVPLLAYLLAIAPVLFAGRASFSGYLAISDSAVHMIGADYLIRHGMDFSHLDLRNSYGQMINAYYNTHYPSGADTLFGASAKLLGLPLIWAFQPFTAAILATATGPAWLLARRMGLDGLLAGLAALCVTLPALVYGYELMASIKEITALGMILSLGALCVLHRLWLRGPARAAIPFALLLAAGVSSLGAAFGIWALTAVLVLAIVAAAELRARELSPGRLAALLAAGGGVALLAAWPTWSGLAGSIQVAQNIASTTNSGNLTSSLHATLVFGAWIWGSYQERPAGADLLVTQALILVTALAAAIGVAHLIRTRALALLGWMALVLLVWLIVSLYVTAWAGAKTIMLTSPVLVLLAWGGVAGLRPTRLRILAPALAVVLAGGVLASDLYQYNTTDLAPTARYDELGSLNSRFAGDGPAIFTGFDEYALYQLRDLDIGGPDFRFRPVDLSGVTLGHGHSVDLERAPPDDLAAYPLIITQRNPLAPRPPSAYSLIWQGAYYQVWRRRPHAPVPAARLVARAGAAPKCTLIGSLAKPGTAGGRLVASLAPHSVRVRLQYARYPAGWSFQQDGRAMRTPGTLTAAFGLPLPGVWELWLQGQMMGTVQVSVDRDRGVRLGGQLGGDAIVPEVIGPLTVRLAAGAHVLRVRRISRPLAPGNGGTTVLSGAYLVPGGAAGQASLLSAPAAGWHSLCGRPLQWVELVPTGQPVAGVPGVG